MFGHDSTRLKSNRPDRYEVFTNCPEGQKMSKTSQKDETIFFKVLLMPRKSFLDIIFITQFRGIKFLKNFRLSNTYNRNNNQY